MHAELATDLSAAGAGLTKDILARRYHVGQPVDLGSAGCVLRIALGGELITRVATDTNIGETPEKRLAWLGDQLTGLRQKIECLAGLRSQRRGMPTLDSSATGVLDLSQVAAGPLANI
jgi:hypothetical protein